MFLILAYVISLIIMMSLFVKYVTKYGFIAKY